MASIYCGDRESVTRRSIRFRRRINQVLELLTRGSHPLMLTKPKASSLVPEGRAQGGHFSFPAPAVTPEPDYIVGAVSVLPGMA